MERIYKGCGRMGGGGKREGGKGKGENKIKKLRVNHESFREYNMNHTFHLS